MSILPVPAYPSKKDIQYALWLKHFAIQLPAYADRYDLAPLQVLQVQCVVGEFIDLLIYRMRCATTSIVLRQPAASRSDYKMLISDALHSIEDGQALSGFVAEVIAHVRQHPTCTDSDTLDLTGMPLLPSVDPSLGQHFLQHLADNRLTGPGLATKF